MLSQRVREFGVCITAIGKDMTQPGKAEADGLEHLGSAVPVLNCYKPSRFLLF